MRLIAALLVLVLLGGAGAAYVVEEEPGWYVRLRYPLRYAHGVRVHAQRNDLDPALVAAVIYTESRFRPHARSSAGAIGLMQLLPETAQGVADLTNGSRFVVADLDDPDINIRYGCRYLRRLRELYRGRPNSLDLALAAYNAGQANVRSWIARTPPGQAVAIPFPETRAYVARVKHLRDLYARGWHDELELAAAAPSRPAGEAVGTVRPG